jgi:3-dehydroquinate synthase
MTSQGTPNVVLIGFMGTGKTAVGRMVASRLGRPFIDTDRLIEERARRPIARIFAEEGEEAFRRLESEVVAEVSAREGAVLATGGGVVLRPENMARLRDHGVIVALRADPRAILGRVGSGEDRPLLGTDRESSIRRLLEERSRAYSHADLTIDTSTLPIDEVVARVLAFVAASTAGGPSGVRATVPERTVRVDLGSRGYDIRIGQGILAMVAEYLRACGIEGRAALLTHPRLDTLYGHSVTGSLRAAGYDIVAVTVPAAESSKSLRVAQRVYDALVEARLDRSSAILVLGGGVAGDLGGFVAATFLRGIRWVAIPTTLLAQVDASIGGKTAVNHPRAKNIIGVLHQPALVVADIETLRSLPRRELRSGMAEVIKTGVIGAPDLFKFLEENLRRILTRNPDALVHVVGQCAQYKAGVVAADEYESAGRIVLNYGHTIGHGIEAAAGYRGLTHGEAIAVGMSLEAAIAVRLGVCEGSLLERQSRLLERTGLPVRLGQLRRGRPPAAEAIVAAMTHDKKARVGRLRFVLPAGIGQTVIRDDVPSRLLEEVLADG